MGLNDDNWLNIGVVLGPTLPNPSETTGVMLCLLK